MKVTKHMEFDMAHRLPYYDGPCKHIHGHRYSVEVTIEGEINKTGRAPTQGMVINFTVLKSIMKEKIINVCDHATMLYDKDPLLKHIDLKYWEKEQNLVLVPYIPTAENMAKHFHVTIQEELATFVYKVVNVRVYETPTGWADSNGL